MASKPSLPVEMSHSALEECDYRIKNIIHHLYKVKNLPLQGSDESVMAIMKQKHGFNRTKQQYERLFKDWGFTKKRKTEDYQTIEWQAQKRSQASKASAVYLDGKLVEAKIWHRQGSMTMPERMKLNREMPETPTGFEIRTPPAHPTFQLAFWNLPILHFQRGFNLFKDTVTMSKEMFENLIVVRNGRESSCRSTIMPLIGGLLPLKALRDEPTAALLTIDQFENLGSTEFLALTVYLLSNNFFGESNGRQAYNWLQARGSASTSCVIPLIASVEGFTGKALLEKIFRLAVEAGDTATVKTLLEAGVKPSGHQISHRRIPDTMEPLQFACVTGSFEMAQLLIAAGANVKDLESKEKSVDWKRSLIVLAIIGENGALEMSPRGFAIFKRHDLNGVDALKRDLESRISDETRETSSSQNISQSTRPIVLEDSEFEPQSDEAIFLIFIEFLISEGAEVNFKPIGKECLGANFPSCLRARHSPLTAASKYRHSQLVRFLLDNGADTGYLTYGGSNALQQCLSLIYNFDLVYGKEHILFRSHSFRNGNIASIVRDLVDAGTELNFHIHNQHEPKEVQHIGCRMMCAHLSPLDFAISTSVTEVLEIFFDAGAKISTHCLQYAITYANLAVVKWLLDHGATIAFKPEPNFFEVSKERNVEATLERCSDRSTKRFAMLAAINLDSWHLVDCVMALGSFDWKALFEFPDLLQNLIDYSLFDTFYLDIDVKLNVIPGILKLECSDVLELWRYINSAANRYLETGRGAFSIMKMRYGELARTTLRIQSPVYTTMKCCQDTCYCHPADAMLATAIRLADNELVSLLIDGGVNINVPKGNFCGEHGYNYQTPLTTAIIAENWKGVDYLLEAGADVNNPVGLPGRWRESAIGAAISKGNDDLYSRLINLGAKFEWQSFPLAIDPKDVPPNLIINDGQGRLGLAVSFDPAIVTFSPQNMPEPPIRDLVIRSVISATVESGQLQLLQEILDTQKQCSTSLITSTTKALGWLLHRHQDPDPKILQSLLDAGADVNGVYQLRRSRTKSFRSMLHTAVASRHRTAVEAMLKVGANPNRSLHPSMDFTVLQKAIAEGDDGIICLLLKYGANPDASSPNESASFPPCWGNPLQMAVEREMEKSVRVLLEYKADPDKTNHFVTHTPLQIAARKGLESIVTILIENGAEVNAPPAADHGATALQYSVMGGFFGIAYFLVQNGADVNAAPGAIGGRTALEGAAEHGRIDIVRYLLNVGSQIHGRGQQQYERALDFATGHGHHSIRELLEKFRG